MYVSIYYSNGVTPLHCAVSNNQLVIVRQLIQAGADLNVATQIKNERTALLMATELDSIAVLSDLINADAKLDITDRHGKHSGVVSTSDQYELLQIKKWLMSQFLNLSKLQLMTLRSYSTHSN